MPTVRRTLQLLEAYIYGRWPKQYIGMLSRHVIPRLSPSGKQKLADSWHGKVLTHDNARTLISVNRSVTRRDLEQIIPYRSARTLILKAPPEIVALECPCRQSQKSPCQPTQVCMMIGRSAARFMLDHHPESTRRLSQDEALDLLQGEHKRGHLHSAWFKDALGGRFYALCNCCRCCCFGIDAMVKHGVPMVAASGYVARVDAAACSSCEACATACPFGAISMNGHAQVAWAACLGCGVCTTQCPESAIKLERDERKGVPLDVRAFS
jgi:Pyruvate/2-oxoacid:ferredoxin oxidoreductase delta subunit